MQRVTMVPNLTAFDIEKAVLGSLLSDLSRNRAIASIVELRPEDFADPKHQQIFQAILALLRSGKEPEPLLVKDVLKNKVTISELMEIEACACASSLVQDYVEVLNQKERSREIYNAVQSAQAAFLKGQDCAEIEDYLISCLMKKRAAAGTTTLAEECDINTFLNNEENTLAVASGIEEIDKVLGGGIKRGEVCVVAARTSIGKSALAVMVALNAAFSDWDTLYMSYEMPKDQIWKRALSYWSRISLRRFRERYFNEFERICIQSAHRDLKQVFSKIRVNTNINKPSNLAALVRIEQMSGRAQFLIIDHAGRMQASGRSEYERMTEIIHSLKDIALQCNIPVLVLWQLSRRVEYTQDKKPTLADLRDSGHVEDVADFVLLLWRDSYYDRDIPVREAQVTVDVAKARDSGLVGIVHIPWLRIISRPTDRQE